MNSGSIYICKVEAKTDTLKTQRKVVLLLM